MTTGPILPDLPEPHGWIGANDLDPDAGVEGYTADDMREYAIAALRNAGISGAVQPGDCIHCGKEICNDLGWCNSFKAAPGAGIDATAIRAAIKESPDA